MLAESGRVTTECRILWRQITRKIHVAQKNVIEEKLLKIKRSITKGEVYIFSRFILGFFVNNYPVFLEFKN